MRRRRVRPAQLAAERRAWAERVQEIPPDIQARCNYMKDSSEHVYEFGFDELPLHEKQRRWEDLWAGAR